MGERRVGLITAGAVPSSVPSYLQQTKTSTLYFIYPYDTSPIELAASSYYLWLAVATKGPYKPQDGRTGQCMNMHRPYWPHRPYTVYMAILCTKQGDVTIVVVCFNEFLKPRTRMWANAQPDGRPAEHRWRPLFNAAKFG